MKILYVEDETEAREALSKYLKRHTGKIFTAADGLEGLHLFQEHLPDLVIVDLYIPQIDGLELIREMKKLSPEVYVIITTAVDDVEVILRSVDIGINKYLLKPINPIELLDAIQEYSSSLEQKRKVEKFFTVEEKRQMEDKIKKEFTSYLKTTTGKGPSGVSVFIDYDTIEITAYDALTIMEKNMLDNCQNSIIIEQYRKLFFSINESSICDLVHEIIGLRTKFQHVEISTIDKTNKIMLQIVR